MAGIGILNMQYVEEYKRSKHLTLTILKEFGFGSRLMETRIETEVAELVAHVKTFQGRSFNPDLTLISSVVNVVYSICFGSRLDRTGERMSKLIQIIHSGVENFCQELNGFPFLRFVPYYKAKMRNMFAFFDNLSDFVSASADDAYREGDQESFVRRYLKAKRIVIR